LSIASPTRFIPEIFLFLFLFWHIQNFRRPYMSQTLSKSGLDEYPGIRSPFGSSAEGIDDAMKNALLTKQEVYLVGHFIVVSGQTDSLSWPEVIHAQNRANRNMYGVTDTSIFWWH
jgi:hypothetical protein